MSNPRWHYVEQRSDEWRALRLGKVTASRVSDLCARTKSGYAASRANYAAELVLERLTGRASEGYTNAAMQHGIDTEPEARNAYEFMYDAAVETVGFIVHPTIGAAGCSPDGCVRADGMIEIKCPQPAAHLNTLLSGAVDDRYIKQIQFQLATAERAWCDYISYQPAFPELMRLFVKRIARDDALIAELEREARAFLSEVDATVAKLTAQYETRLAA